MTTPTQYAKQQITAGAFPMMVIEAGRFNTFWLHDSDYRMLDSKAFTSREAAEKARSRAIDSARRLIGR